MKLYLGLDGGGTKTAAVIVDDAGHEWGRGSGGPCNIASHADAVLAGSVRDAVAAACRAAGFDPASIYFRGVGAGVAGYSAPSRREPFLQILRQIVRGDAYHLDGDFVAAYWGATGGEPGVIIIAGTGAVAYGRNGEGQTHQEDGLGYLLGDKGSGYWIGMQALKTAVKYLRRTSRATPVGSAEMGKLSSAICAHIGAASIGELVQWLYPGFSTARVAELAPVVGRLADAGDEWGSANLILQDAAGQLRTTVVRTFQALNLPNDTPVVPLGGLWHISPRLRARFENPPHRIFLGPDGKPRDPQPDRRLRLAEPNQDAAIGAALLARNAAQAVPRR